MTKALAKLAAAARLETTREKATDEQIVATATALFASNPPAEGTKQTVVVQRIVNACRAAGYSASLSRVERVMTEAAAAAAEAAKAAKPARKTPAKKAAPKKAAA